MKKTMKNFLSMAALALVSAVMTGCSSDEDSFTNNQQSESNGNIVTLTTTVSQGADTRALTSAGVKTFAAGDRIAVIYKNTSNETVKAVSEALPAGDYGATATFTVTLTDPKPSAAVRYIYPAAMAAATVATDAVVNADANVNYAALATQNGTLATLASTLDLGIYDGSLTAGAELPATSVVLANQLAICAFTLKNSDASSDITNTITSMTISDGTNGYVVTRSAAAGPIYVAIKPTSSANISYTAIGGSKSYNKNVTGKTYSAGNIYQLGLRMAEPPAGAKILSTLTNFELGWVIATDGYAYAPTTTGITKVAIVAYVGSAGSVDDSSASYKGLAIAMSDAYGGSTCYLYNDEMTCVSQTTDMATAIGYKNGISSTATLTSDGHTHEAATAAVYNNYNAAPSGTSGWFLPSMGQWNLIVQGLATKKSGYPCTTDLSSTINNTFKSSNLNSVITDAGGTGFQSVYYWSSTDFNTTIAWSAYFFYGIAIDKQKTGGMGKANVRSVLAF